MIGLKRGEVKLLQYTDEWAKLYEQEEKILYSLIGDYAADIQHVGSTSIPDIIAKPIIDIAIGMKSFDRMNEVIKILEENSFEYRPDSSRDGECLFIKGGEDYRTHHIHIARFCGEQWNNYILFRNYLRNNSDARKEYCQLKNNLASKYSMDRKKYTESKIGFIQSIIERAKNENK